MSATLDIERNMNVLLKERQLELKRDHMSKLSELKTDLDRTLERSRRETEQKVSVLLTFVRINIL